jgi:RimJ/RimL family protein N-acetyltransferase
MRERFEQLFPIETARLVLTPLTRADAPAVARLTDDPAITISFLPKPFRLEDAETLIAGLDGGRHRFAGLRADSALIGILGVFFHTASAIEVGYWIGTAHQGNGYATEALGGVVKALGAKMPGAAVFAECRDGNLASRRVLTKAGFRATGEAGHRPGMQRYAIG